MKNETEILGELDYWQGVLDGLGGIKPSLPANNRVQAQSTVRILSWVLSDKKYRIQLPGLSKKLEFKPNTKKRQPS